VKAAVDLDAKELATMITLRVRIRRMRRWRVRLWIGCRLIRLASWVMWVPVEIEQVEP